MIEAVKLWWNNQALSNQNKVSQNKVSQDEVSQDEDYQDEARTRPGRGQGGLGPGSVDRRDPASGLCDLFTECGSILSPKAGGQRLLVRMIHEIVVSKHEIGEAELVFAV